MKPTIRWIWRTGIGFLAGWFWMSCSPASLILPGEGITGVSIGDTAEMVVATLGDPQGKTTRVVAGQDSPILEYFMYKPLGLDIFFQDERVKTIFLYNEGSEDHHIFPGRSPNGIHLGSTRSDVLELLGEPEDKGAGAFQDRLYMYRHGIDFTVLPDDTIHHIVLRPPTNSN